MRIGDWTRQIYHGIVNVDRSAVEVGYALRCTIGVAIPLLAALAAGHPRLGFAPAFGALITGFSSLQGIYRSRLATMLAVTCGIAVASFVGAIAAPSVVALVVIAAIVGYLYGTVSQLGMPASVAALNTTVAFVIFSSIPLPPSQALAQSGLLLCGGLVQLVLLLIVWPIDRFAIERQGLSAAYRELAAYAAAIVTAPATPPPIAAMSRARQIAADGLPFARARDAARFKRVLDEAEALRSRLSALRALETTVAPDEKPPFDAFVSAVAAQLDALASMLDGTRDDAALKDTRLKTIAAFDAFEHATGRNEFARALGRDITGHLADATQGIAVVTTGHPARLLFSATPRPAAYIETRIDWAGSRGVRNSAVLAIAMLIGHTAFSSDRGYWIALTAALVLRPDFQSTLVRGFARLAGTLVGAVVAALTQLFTQGIPVRDIGALIVTAAACYLTLMPNYAVFSTGITVFVIVSLELGLARHGTIGFRVMDTVIGGALAMIGYALLPTWSGRRTRPLLVEYIGVQREFAVALLDTYATHDRTATRRLQSIRTRAWKIRTEVETAIEVARAEPHRAHTIETDRALAILAATQSIAVSSMALESGLETMVPAPPIPQLATLRDELDAALREIAAALNDGRHAVVGDGVERAYEKLSDAASGSPLHDFVFVVTYAAGYVHAVRTLADLT